MFVVHEYLLYRSCGSNLRFAHAELGMDALTAEGYQVLGGYISPVNDLYQKKVPLSSLETSFLSDEYCVPYLSCQILCWSCFTEETTDLFLALIGRQSGSQKLHFLCNSAVSWC